jgi:hypothetical protein
VIGVNLVSVGYNGKIHTAKPKKAGLILTAIGGAWILRVLVFMIIPPFFLFAFIACFIVSIMGPILALNRTKGASIISLIGGILNFFAVLGLVVANGIGFVPFDRLILSGFMIMFLTIPGFGNFGIPAILFLIGGVLSYKTFYKKGKK